MISRGVRFFSQNINSFMSLKKIFAVCASAVLLSVFCVNVSFALSGPGAGGSGFENTSPSNEINTFEGTYETPYDGGGSGGGSGSGTNRIRTFSDIFNFILNTINDIIVLLIALGVVWTMYYAFVLVKVDGEGKDEARNSIIYGLVGIFVMVSVWGLVNIFIETFDVKEGNNNRPSAPTIQRR